MFCRNCGHQLADGDKFCSSCGAKTEAATAASAVENTSPVTPAEDKPLFEPFDFKAFGFDFSDLGLGTGIVKEETSAEETKPTPPTEEFNWNTGAFPDRNATSKTEDVNFNWSLSPEEVEKTPEPEIFTAPEPEWTTPEPVETKELEDELFGDIGSKADETRKQSEEIDKFFTFHKKNEEFQKILDREYEKVKSGNIITEEMNAADAVSEEKFTARQPEDPMEALFASEGVIKGYEPKPIETDVLDRIEAAEAEKRIREEAERIAAEERAKMAAEAESAPEAEAPEVEPAAEEVVVEEVAVEEVAAEEAVAEEIVEEAEEEPEKTKQVDKAAILAGMALASEMVERDKAFAAAQEAEAAAAAEELKLEIPDFLGHEEAAEAPAAEETVEEIAVEEVVEEPVTEITPEPVSVEEAVEEISLESVVQDALAAVEEPVEEPAEEELPELELDIFEQLEAVETPAEEITLSEEQSIADLFAEEPAEETVTEHTVVLTEDSVAEILKTVEEDTTKDDTMVFTAHALGALLAEAEQTDPDAKEVVVSLEELTSLEQQAAEGTLPGIGELAAAKAAEEVQETIQGGKGRTFLKICLVILVILLVVEIAGVAIKIAAPTSGAANFIDNQLEKVFQLIGDEDTDLEVLSADNDFEA